MLLRPVGIRSVGRLRLNVPIQARIHASICDIDMELRNDVKKLGKTLGVSIKQHDPKVFDTVEELRALGREVRAHRANLLTCTSTSQLTATALKLFFNSGACPKASPPLSKTWSPRCSLAMRTCCTVLAAPSRISWLSRTRQRTSTASAS